MGKGVENLRMVRLGTERSNLSPKPTSLSQTGTCLADPMDWIGNLHGSCPNL